MRDLLGPGTRVGYCTNVHAGATLEAIRAALQRHALDVRRRLRLDEGTLGVGLWLPGPAAAAVLEGDALGELAAWLDARGLDVFTLNGFPQGDFHDATVKHRVYEPAWTDAARRDYTRDLLAIVAALSDDDEPGLSTLPLGWRAALPGWREAPIVRRHLLDVVALAVDERARSGRVLHVDLEPEPGCCLERAADVVALVERLDADLAAGARPGIGPDDLRRHLRVCHDVCHAAVVHEPQAEALATYRAAGVRVGKVQISSAVRCRFDALAPSDRPEALRQLAACAEPRYLHQTVVRTDDGATSFFEDLPAALAATAGAPPAGEWRVHLHVPIDLESFGLLETTRDEIERCLGAFAPDDGVRHLEVETYAWDVLPEPLRVETLAEGIARELAWLRDLAATGTAIA